jgi:hypothetical protein
VTGDPGRAMRELSEVQLRTLGQLARKKAGDAVAFVNIAAARALSEMGLASRSHEGWDITAEGSAELALRAGPPA